MKLKNVSVQKLLISVFSLFVMFVLIVGLVSINQSNQLNEQTEVLYSHPLRVRDAFFNIKVTTLDSGIKLRNLLEVENEEHIDDLVAQINVDYLVIEANILILQEDYLGPEEDIINLVQSYQVWKSYRTQTLNYILAKDYVTAANRLSIEGQGEINRETFMNAIDVVDTFSSQMADNLFLESKALATNLIIMMLVLLSIFIAVILVANRILLKQIILPIKAISKTTREINTGNYTARVNYVSGNEFGDMCELMNKMIETIDINNTVQTMINNFSEAIVKANTPDTYPDTLIFNLCEVTNSQAGVFYLKSKDTGLMRKISSIGFSSDVSKDFDINQVKKEFGFSIFSKKIKVVKNIPDRELFIISTTYGNFYPSEIMTIPIIVDGLIVGLISLGTTNKYKTFEIEIVNQMLEMITSRTEGMLANLKIKDFMIELEQQNQELEQQHTEMEQMNQELEQQNIELEIQKNQLDEVSTHKTNFLSTMSHELRTPLNSVIALSGVLGRQLKDKISEEELGYLEVIERNGKNLLLLINDILDISRIESGRTEIDITHFNLCSVLADQLENIHHVASEKGLALNRKCEYDAIEVDSDKDKFEHIVQNLLSNAVKFTDKGSITISAKEENDNVVVSVEDTGIGISKKHIPYIFDEFRQADASTSRKYGGTGLGLAIAKKYSKMLGGTLTVSSRLGEGSIFTLTIAKKLQEKTLQKSTSNVSEVKGSKPISFIKHDSKRILVIDDNEAIRVQLKSLLEDDCYEVVLASDEDEALEKITEKSPDLILLDLVLPDVDGFKILEHIRNDDSTRDIPVMIITSKHITKEELQNLERNNVYQYIQKGNVNPNNLLTAIYQTLFDYHEKNENDNIIDDNENKPLILIVEDNLDNMITAVALLKDHFNLIKATDGLMGVNKAIEYNPDLILMDIALPKMDGIQAFKEIRKYASLINVPIIALTASAMKQDRNKLLAYGFTAFIAKPIQEKTFIKKIKEVLYGK